MTRKRRLSKLPPKYESGFLDELDRRTEVYRRLREQYDAIVADAGGVDSLSHTKLALIERFVFLEACLRTWENQIATDPKASEHLLSRWIQGLNSLQGLAKIIGLERQMRKADLRAYVEERRS